MMIYKYKILGGISNMAKKKISVSIKGLLDLENRTITEFDKNEGEITHKLDDLLINFNGLDNVSLSLSYDSEILPE